MDFHWQRANREYSAENRATDVRRIDDAFAGVVASSAGSRRFLFGSPLEQGSAC